MGFPDISLVRHTLFLTHWFGKDHSSLPQYPHSPSSSVTKLCKAKDGIETKSPSVRSTWKYCVNCYRVFLSSNMTVFILSCLLE